MENDYDIPLEDYGTPYVTIEEMKELLSSRKKKWGEPPYQELRLDEQSGLYYTDYFAHNGIDLLQAHLLVEQCLEHLEKLDWKRITNCYDFDVMPRIQHLIENPLVWVEEMPYELAKQFVVTGRVAVEKSSEERNTCAPYCDLQIIWFNEQISWFATVLPTCKDLGSTYGYYDVPQDMILWDRILTDPYEKLCAKLYAPRKEDPYTGKTFWPYCNPDNFRQEIDRIYDRFGAQKAAQIVRLLRQDWQDIKVLKLFGVDKLTPEQVEEFRQCLFEGMDRSLRMWDAEEQKEQTIETVKCKYIDLDKLAEIGIHTPEEFTQALRQACEQDAPTLGIFLKKNFKLGYLDFHGDGKKNIYNHLKECFPQGLNYSYTNFTLYFD